MDFMRNRNLAFGVLLGSLIIGMGSAAWGENSVVVVSDTAAKGATDFPIYVKLTNDINVRNVVIPLVFREVTPGAFVTSVKKKFRERLVDNLKAIHVFNQLADTVGGACKNRLIGGFKTITYASDTTNSNPVDASPEGFLLTCGKLQGSEPTMPPGADVTGSMLFLVSVTSVDGVFEIDTTCTNPNNHLLFVQDTTNASFVPTFTKGIIGIGNPSAVEYLGGDGIPRGYSLDQNYPNPFNASTVIRFNTKHDGNVRLEVFNILGQKVKTLVDEFRHFGPQAADWDGTNAAGQTVPTGLYFYRLVTSDYTDVKKMVLLK